MCATYADPAQPLTTTGEERDDLDHDLSDLSESVPARTSHNRARGRILHMLYMYGVTWKEAYVVPCQRPDPFCVLLLCCLACVCSIDVSIQAEQCGTLYFTPSAFFF